MSNEQVAVLLKAYLTLLIAARVEMEGLLLPEQFVIIKNPLHIPGINEKEFISYPVLVSIDKVINLIEESIDDLLKGE